MERKPRVDPLVPTRAIDWKLGKVHVGTPDAEVVALFANAVDTARQRDSRWQAHGERRFQTLKRQVIRYALWRHHRNLAEYQQVMAGTRHPVGEFLSVGLLRKLATI